MSDEYLHRYGYTKEEIDADPDFFTPETLAFIEREKEKESIGDEYHQRFMDIEREFGGKYSYVDGVKIRIADHEGSSRNDPLYDETKLSFIIRHPNNAHKRSFHGDHEMAREFDISRMDTEEAIRFIYEKIDKYRKSHPEEFEEELDESRIIKRTIMKEESDAFPYNDEDISFRSVGENALRSENGHRMFADVLKNRLVKNGISIDDVEKTFAPDFSKKFLPWFFENYGEEIEKMAVAACEFYLSDSPEFDGGNDVLDEFDDYSEDYDDSFYNENHRSLRYGEDYFDDEEVFFDDLIGEAMYFNSKTGKFSEDDAPSKDEFEDMDDMYDIGGLETDEGYPSLEDLWGLEGEFLEVAKVVSSEVDSQYEMTKGVEDTSKVDMPLGLTMERLVNMASEMILSILKNNDIEAHLVQMGSLKYPVAVLADGSRYAVVVTYDKEPEVSVLEWRS